MSISENSTQQVSSVIVSLEDIRHLVQNDFERVNGLILESLHSDVELIRQVSQYIIEGGGKRLRPLLTLLAARAFGYQGESHIKLAAIVEFLHTATLLHDDVVDNSDLRRGRPTANTIWGNQASILVGDFIYSRTFQIMISLQNLSIMSILANATNTIAQGEVLQLMNRNNPDISETHYLDVIRCKTAVLFAAAAEVGAHAAECTSQQQQAIATYGLYLGMAFQMIDDWLDYAVAPEETGKNLGDDLAEGKLTLPLIYAMQHGTEAESALIRSAIKQGGLADFSAIRQIIESTQAFVYVKALAEQQAELAKAALVILPDNVFKQALLVLAQLAVDRTS
ncbi:MAG TPA: polyprenyl synthetase family protein [Gammaproteobacteria bacterium]|nr:polyprenyl synthetase family protein [Gammaproteobacteria bacterium]